MSKQQFIKEVSAIQSMLSAEALQYFEKYVAAKRVNKKAEEKATVVKNSIVEFFKANVGKQFDRTEIAKALFDNADIDEEFLLNEKGELAFNSITAYSNQLVTEGKLQKIEVKEGKTKRMKYFC